MKTTAIYYYTRSRGFNPVILFLDSLEKPQKAKMLRTLQTYGLAAAIQHVKKITNTSLWEIRILGKDNIRVIYACIDRDAILLLHGFIKKSQKTDMQDLSLALNRYQEWKKRAKYIY